MSSFKFIILLALASTSALSADPDKKKAVAEEPLPQLTFLIQNGWMPPHLHCAAILSGLSYAPATFPFLPYGGLSQTLDGFHPSKLQDDRDVAWRDTGTQVILRGPFQGSVIERTFQKLQTGYTPLNWGKFSTSFQEYDPIYGIVHFQYNMDASKVLINAATTDDIVEIEERFAHQLRHSISPLNLKMVSDLLNKNRKKEGEVRITRNTALTAVSVDLDEDLGSLFFADPDVSIAPHFCFHHAPDRLLHVDYTVSPDSLAFTMSAVDDQGFTQKVRYIMARTQTGLGLMELQLSLAKNSFSSNLSIEFAQRQTVLQNIQRHRGFERSLALHTESFNQMYYERIMALSDGIIELREVQDENGRAYAPVFFANLQDSKDGRIELKFSTALAVSLLGVSAAPAMIQYNHRYYDLTYENASQLTLTDKVTGQKHEGTYRYEKITDFEAGHVPMLYFSIKGLPGI